MRMRDVKDDLNQSVAVMRLQPSIAQLIFTVPDDMNLDGSSPLYIMKFTGLLNLMPTLVFLQLNDCKTTWQKFSQFEKY